MERQGKEERKGGKREGGLESIGCLTYLSLALSALATVLPVVRGNNSLKSRFVIYRSVCIVRSASFHAHLPQQGCNNQLIVHLHRHSFIISYTVVYQGQNWGLDGCDNASGVTKCFFTNLKMVTNLIKIRNTPTCLHWCQLLSKQQAAPHYLCSSSSRSASSIGQSLVVHCKLG